MRLPWTVSYFVLDMRLRPYGDSGALCSGFDALEQVITRARVATGEALRYDQGPSGCRDQQQGAQLRHAQTLCRIAYLDFAAIEALRSLKLISSARRTAQGLQDNVKLGSGGSREVEFIGQAFQLIHRGATVQRPILAMLEARRTATCRTSGGRNSRAPILS